MKLGSMWDLLVLYYIDTGSVRKRTAQENNFDHLVVIPLWIVNLTITAYEDKIICHR